MSNKLTVDSIGNVQNFRLILSKRGFTHLGQLKNVDYSSFVLNMNLNSANEISFTVYKEFDGIEEPLWDNLIDFKLIYIPDIKEYFEIEITTTENSKGVYKSVTGTSLCEAELSQVELNDIEINTEDDIDRDDYVVAKFYDKDDYKNCLLGRILDKVPHYKIGHVDESLWNIQRSYSVNGKSIYNFLTDECAEQTNCIFQFDSTSRTINIYDLSTVCLDCGHRGTYNDVCPECGSTNLKYFGEDTAIYVDRENLSDEISFETDVDSVKNTFKLEAGDDEMTAAVINMNPNGSQYLYYFSEETLDDMSDKLSKAITDYNTLLDSKTQEYEKNTENLYETIDKIQYYTSSMMPEHTTEETSASQQASLLNVENLSPTAIQSVTTATNVATVNSALVNYAKVYIKTGYYKVAVKTGKFTYVGKDSEGYGYGNWTGSFTVTNYSDEEDTADSKTITVKITEKYDSFLQQKMDKLIAKEDDDEMSIYQVLSQNHTLESFKKAITYYSLNRLKSFYDAIQTCLDVLIEADQGSSSADFYQDLYVPYKEKLEACQTEMDKRSVTVDEWTEKYNEYLKIRNNIQNELNFKNYLDVIDQNLYAEFCSYRREDTYSNDNYISDGLENTEIFDNAKQFLTAAKEAIVESGEYQHSLSSDLYNLLLIDAFKPLVDKFELGNWIRVGIEGKVYRLRLTSYKLSFSNLSQIDVSFSELTTTAKGYNDIKSVLDDAKSMSTSFSYIQYQAKKGDEANTLFSDWRKSSLDASLYNITSTDSANITIDNHGILGRSYDDVANSYSEEQIRINNNVIAFTSDNWKSVSTALGKITYNFNGQTITKYGLNADTVISGTIIGGDIYSQNYNSINNVGTHFNLTDGSFEIADGSITYRKDSSGNHILSMSNVALDFSSTTDIDGSKLSGYLTDSAKVATNYLYYDSTNGLVISETGSVSPSGAYTAIVNNGITIGSGSSIYAKYGTDIELYENNKIALKLNSSEITMYKPNSEDVAFKVNNSGSLLTNSTSDSYPTFEVTADGIIKSKGGLTNKSIEISGGNLYLPQSEQSGDTSIGGIYINEYPIIQGGYWAVSDATIGKVAKKVDYTQYNSIQIGGTGTDQIDINKPTAVWDQMRVLGNIDGTDLFGESNTYYSYIGKLGNIYATDTITRPTTANMPISGSGGLCTFKATSSMTTGKPATDGHIIHFDWDNLSGYDTQFAVLNRGIGAQIRGQNNGIWKSWNYLVTSPNISAMKVFKQSGTITLTNQYNGLKFGLFSLTISGFSSVSDVFACVRSTSGQGLFTATVNYFDSTTIKYYIWGNNGTAKTSVIVEFLVVGVLS